MNWKKLFAIHILERGYDYYCDDAVENMEISDDIIRADVIGSEDYEVEISLSNGEVTDMYCSSGILAAKDATDERWFKACGTDSC